MVINALIQYYSKSAQLLVITSSYNEVLPSR